MRQTGASLQLGPLIAIRTDRLHTRTHAQCTGMMLLTLESATPRMLVVVVVGVLVVSASREKPLKEIQSEIAGIIRQITASVSFLPLLSEPCAFDLLVYTDSDADVPRAWEESDPRYIKHSDEVQLRSFTTKIHKVDASVSYRRGAGADV